MNEMKTRDDAFKRGVMRPPVKKEAMEYVFDQRPEKNTHGNQQGVRQGLNVPVRERSPGKSKTGKRAGRSRRS